jgi:hypothetical protein
MAVRNKRTINKDTVGTLVKSDAMTELDDGTEGFVEQSSAMVQVYWSILRNNPVYKKDYKELQINKEVGTFTDKWSLHDPIDPKEDNVNPFYFYQDSVPFMHTGSRGVKEDSYCLTIDLDIRRKKSDLKKEIEEIIDEEKNNALGMKRPKNLFGDTRTETAEHYERLLYVHKLKLEVYKFNEIKKIAKKERSDFEEYTLKNALAKLEELEEKVRVRTKTE